MGQRDSSTVAGQERLDFGQHGFNGSTSEWENDADQFEPTAL